MSKAHKYLLSLNIRSNFVTRVRCYNIKGLERFVKPKIQTSLKDRCTLVQGIRLWNNMESDYKLNDELKFCLIT